MSFPSQLILVFAIFAPIFIFIIVSNLKVRRKNRQQELEGDVPPPPFEPASEPPPGIFLRRFNQAQRVYLRAQRATARFGGLYAAWIFFVLLSCGLLPQSVDRYGIDQSLPQRVWFSYLSDFATVGGVCGIIALVTSFIALSNLVSTSSASFIRTRPLTLRFLFWARVGPALASLLAALIIAAACSLLLLLALYGPVWKHLFENSNSVPVALAPPVQHIAHSNFASVILSTSVQHAGTKMVFLGSHGHIQAMHLVASLQTSPLRLFLSAITTTLLIFSIVAVLITLPGHFQRIKLITVMFVWCLVLFFEASVMIGGLTSPRLARTLFLYASPGSPPPYAFALIPLLLSIAFLCLAQFQATRLET